MSINTDKQAVAERWAEILDAQGAHALMAAPMTALPKDIFCKDWPTAKQVLEALKPYVPQPGPIIIGIIIGLGDAAYQTVCQTK